MVDIWANNAQSRIHFHSFLARSAHIWGEVRSPKMRAHRELPRVAHDDVYLVGYAMRGVFRQNHFFFCVCVWVGKRCWAFWIKKYKFTDEGNSTRFVPISWYVNLDLVCGEWGIGFGKLRWRRIKSLSPAMHVVRNKMTRKRRPCARCWFGKM